MDSGRENSNTRITRKKKGMFMRMIDWIARGAAKAERRGGCAA
ncbi:MAG: hypothetical protein PVG39_23995 [Desulfobacteraceae bacterium]|jgi:hypothetical protein